MYDHAPSQTLKAEGANTVSVWMFVRDGKMHGNYTRRPLLKTLLAAEAVKLRSILANP
jgi:uncharacterized protein YegJ (DUF2314 family)